MGQTPRTFLLIGGGRSLALSASRLLHTLVSKCGALDRTKRMFDCGMSVPVEAHDA